MVESMMRNLDHNEALAVVATAWLLPLLALWARVLASSPLPPLDSWTLWAVAFTAGLQVVRVVVGKPA